VNVNQERALLDPGCEAELVLSTNFATSCGIQSHVDEDILVEFPDGTKVPSAAIENVNLCVAGVAHPVRAIVVELASYEVILGKPWFTRHNPIVDWRTASAEDDGRLQVCGGILFNGPAVSGVPFHYQNLSNAVGKGGSTKGAGLLSVFLLNYRIFNLSITPSIL
jgi:Retroviral aspartyl protease